MSIPEASLTRGRVSIIVDPGQSDVQRPPNTKSFSLPLGNMVRTIFALTAVAGFQSATEAAHQEFLVLGADPRTQALFSWQECADVCESLGWQIACVEDDDANEAAQLAIDSFPNEMEGLPDVDGLTVVGRLGTWIGYSTVDQADWTPPYDPAEDYGTFVWHGACSPKDQYENWADFNSIDAESEPNNYKGPRQRNPEIGHEACVEMSPLYDGVDFTPHWNDIPCDAQNYCMCSRDSTTGHSYSYESYSYGSYSYGSYSYSYSHGDNNDGSDNDGSHSDH